MPLDVVGGSMELEQNIAKGEFSSSVYLLKVNLTDRDGIYLTYIHGFNVFNVTFFFQSPRGLVMQFGPIYRPITLGIV